MEVIAFVGPSGSGKSHRAIGISHEHHCDAIIDDGILIKGAKILGGSSAKNAESRIQAVRRAIFSDDAHADEVRRALAVSDIKRLLILATSDNMIQKIIDKLVLPQPTYTVYISDIATKSEIKKAKESRLKYGKHIVPVPTVELKPHFTGYFADLPYNIFSKTKRKKVDNRSIVRPAFSFYGQLLIADYVIEDIINLIADKMLAVSKITQIQVKRRSDSRAISISIEVILYYGVNIFEVTKLLQKRIKEKVEYMTAMQVKNVDVSIRSLDINKKEAI